VTTVVGRPPFPGGTSVSHLRVYDWPAADLEGGAGSGTPHLHTASAEAYVVVAGAGEVQTLGADGYAETGLAPGVVVWFTPGVVHRLVNRGGLELVVVMSNSGLPEAGDAVLTFPPEVLADVGRYRAAAALPAQTPDRPDDHTIAAAARARRDRALEGFAALRERVGREGPGALADLHAAAARLVAEHVPQWQEIVRDGVERPTAGAVQALADLARGAGPSVAGAQVRSADARPGPLRYGMCGRLRTWEI
jgi:mannose-6-phosphate isomerase-like protein (cupin superfamily)